MSGTILPTVCQIFGGDPVTQLNLKNVKNVFLTLLGVRSLANTSRARQCNPQTPWGAVGTASSNKYGSRGRSCAVVCGRSCVVMHGRARAVVRAWSVIRGCAWSSAIGPFCPLRGQHCRGTNERTTYNNPLNPPWGGVGQFFF